jgi:hypothetical protein
MPTYADLLNSNEWKRKRLQIIARDKDKCQFCFNEKFLKYHAFGKGYIRNTDESSWSRKSRNNAPWYLYIFDPLNNKKLDVVFWNDYYNPKSDYIVYFYPFYTCQAKIIALHKFEINYKRKSYSKTILINKALNETQNTVLPVSNDKDKFVVMDFNEYFNQIKIEFEQYMISVLKEEENWKSLNWDYIFGLNVHHKCYRSGKNPWEYDNSDLITACELCHTKIHESHNNKVPVFDDNNDIISYFTPCSRCNGVGMLPEYIHVQAGICFRCNGAQYDELILN